MHISQAWENMAKETQHDQGPDDNFPETDDPTLDCGGFKGGGQRGGWTSPLRPRIFSIRRPSIRRFLIALLCCLKNVAVTCKFAADIVKIILAIITMGTTIGVSSVILYYLAKAVQALGCYGFRGVAGGTADLCSCTLGAVAAGAITGPSVQQIGMITAAVVAVGGVAAAANMSRMQRITEKVRVARANRLPAREAAAEHSDETTAAAINATLEQSWKEWFEGGRGTLNTYGKRILDFLCAEPFRDNVDAWLQQGIYPDIRLILHEIEMLLFIKDARGSRGLINDADADMESLSKAIRDAHQPGRNPAPTLSHLAGDSMSAVGKYFLIRSRVVGEFLEWLWTAGSPKARESWAALCSTVRRVVRARAGPWEEPALEIEDAITYSTALTLLNDREPALFAPQPGTEEQELTDIERAMADAGLNWDDAVNLDGGVGGGGINRKKKKTRIYRKSSKKSKGSKRKYRKKSNRRKKSQTKIKKKSSKRLSRKRLSRKI